MARPPDVTGMSGEDAEWMWRAWERDRDAGMRRRLLRYCATDVITLQALAAQLIGRPAPPDFALLDTIADAPSAAPAPPAAGAGDDPLTARLRAHHRRRLSRPAS